MPAVALSPSDSSMTPGGWSVSTATESQKLDRKPCGAAACVIARASLFRRTHHSRGVAPVSQIMALDRSRG